MTRRRRRRRRRATRKTSNTRRKPMVRHTLERSGTPMSSDYDTDDVATVAIKGTSSNKSLFPNLNKGMHTCLMAKESKKKVKSKFSPPKYVI
jgi:hypothetical protein